MSKSYQKECRDNMSDEQKQKLKDYQKKYRDYMSDEQKQKQFLCLIIIFPFSLFWMLSFYWEAAQS